MRADLKAIDYEVLPNYHINMDPSAPQGAVGRGVMLMESRIPKIMLAHSMSVFLTVVANATAGIINIVFVMSNLLLFLIGATVTNPLQSCTSQ